MVRNILWRWDIVLSQDASWISGNGAFRNNWLKILVFFERAFINLWALEILSKKRLAHFCVFSLLPAFERLCFSQSTYNISLQPFDMAVSECLSMWWVLVKCRLGLGELRCPTLLDDWPKSSLLGNMINLLLPYLSTLNKGILDVLFVADGCRSSAWNICTLFQHILLALKAFLHLCGLNLLLLLDRQSKVFVVLLVEDILGF